jgi:hypothetical protein
MTSALVGRRTGMGRVLHGVVVLVRDGAEVARWPITTGRPPDVGLLDVLARLQLVVRRVGCSARVVDPSAELADLVRFAGLGWLVDGCRSVGRQVGGEPEEGEQPGVEEVVVTDDPVA